MKLKNILIAFFILGSTSVFANSDDFTQYCTENADSLELSGEERSDYIADCLYQYSTEEPAFDESYEEDSYSEETEEPESLD